MLQMNCSHCEGLIKSPLLAEVQVIECPQCAEIVGVKNVVVSTGTFSSSLRSSLKDLLVSARDKFRLNKSRDATVQSNFDLNKRLARLLKRDDFRLNLSDDLYVQVNFDHNKRFARLLNISSTGAAIEFLERGQVPEEQSDIKFQLLLPGYEESILLLARVVWSRKNACHAISQSITTGVQFLGIDEEIRTCLWDFIVAAETAPQADE